MKKFVLIFLFLLGISGTAGAAVRYEAEVHADMTGKSVSEAKKKAMAQAVRDGLNEVVLSISTEESLGEINKLTDNQLQHFVESVMVLMEKNSDVRYIADLKISYNGEVLKAYMAENGMPFVVGEEQDVLAVPVLEKEDGTIDLWGEDNFWRKAWAERKGLQKGNLNIRLIEKNLGNIAACDAQKIYEMGLKAYNELSRFNNVENIYVLKYSLKDGKIYVKSFPDGRIEETDIGDDNLDTAINRSLAFFKDVKRNDRPVQKLNAEVEKIEVVYSYLKLSSWMKLKKILDDNPQVFDVKVVSMANGKVHFNFNYSGVLEKLQAGLKVQGYNMVKEGGHYVIN